MIDKALEKIVRDLGQKMSFSITELTIELDELSGARWCHLSSPDSKFLIGRDGEALNAFTHVVKKILEKELPEGSTNVIIDVNGYQKRRIDKLKTVAHMMAERARFFKSSVDVDPMSAFERKIIHEYIQNLEDLETESVGTGSARHIVIRYRGGLSV